MPPHVSGPFHADDDDVSYISAWACEYSMVGNTHGMGAPRHQAPMRGCYLRYPPEPIPLQAPEYNSLYSPSHYPPHPNPGATLYHSEDAQYTQPPACYAGPPASTSTQEAAYHQSTYYRSRLYVDHGQAIDPGSSYSQPWCGLNYNDVPPYPTFPFPSVPMVGDSAASLFSGYHGHEETPWTAPMSQQPHLQISTDPSTPFSLLLPGPAAVPRTWTSYQDHMMTPAPSGMPLPSHDYPAYICPAGGTAQAYQLLFRPVLPPPVPENPVPEMQVQTTFPQAFPSTAPDHAGYTPFCVPPPMQRSTFPVRRLSATTPAFIPSGLPVVGMPLPFPSPSPPPSLAESIPPWLPSCAEDSLSQPIATDRAPSSSGPSLPVPFSDTPLAPSCSERDSPDFLAPVVTDSPSSRSVHFPSFFPLPSSGHEPFESCTTNGAGSHVWSENINSSPPLRASPPVRWGVSDDYPSLLSSAPGIAQPPSPPPPHMSPQPAHLSPQRTIEQAVGSRGIQQSKPVRLADPIPIDPYRCTGNKKALLIGIKYDNTRRLVGSVKDALNMKKFLMEYYGFIEGNIVVLTDSTQSPNYRPTRANIIRGIKWLVDGVRKNDSLVFLFSGHGCQVTDRNGDERDGKDEAIEPVDHKTKGVIVDDTLHELMVKPLPDGSQLVALVDACSSGSALDLPFSYCTSGCLKRSEVARAFQAEKTVSADVIMWSGCKDKGEAEDEDEGGAMVSAFLRIAKRSLVMSVLDIHNAMRDEIKGRHSQKPQLSSSHAMDIRKMRFMM